MMALQTEGSGTVTLTVALIGAVAVVVVGVLNFYIQRRALKQQRDLLERQLKEQREQAEAQRREGLEDSRRQLEQLEFQRRQSQEQLEVARIQVQHNLEATQEQLRLSQEGQITDLFTRAIDQLGADATTYRIGGVYALERIAKNSPSDRGPIAEILTAFIRSDRLKRLGNLPDMALKLSAPDLQAAMWVLARRDHEEGDPRHIERLELSDVNLPRADLVNAHLENANLAHARMSGSNLSDANLSASDLSDSSLDEAVLANANLRGANLSGADLRGADLTNADLTDARLTGAIVSSATMWSVDQAFLRSAGVRWEG